MAHNACEQCRWCIERQSLLKSSLCFSYGKQGLSETVKIILNWLAKQENQKKCCFFTTHRCDLKVGVQPSTQDRYPSTTLTMPTTSTTKLSPVNNVDNINPNRWRYANNIVVVFLQHFLAWRKCKRTSKSKNQCHIYGMFLQRYCTLAHDACAYVNENIFSFWTQWKNNKNIF